MFTTSTAARYHRARNLTLLSNPALWPLWPFLPVVRRRAGRPTECGLLCDVLHLTGQPGGGATVYLANLFLLPATLEQFLEQPREVYDTAAELFDAGWRID
jgi:hypothetical protein